MANGEIDDAKVKALKEEALKVKALCKLYDQSFWLYTVIIALAIRQVLIEIIPRFLNYFFTTAFPLPTPATFEVPCFSVI